MDRCDLPNAIYINLYGMDVVSLMVYVQLFKG